MILVLQSIMFFFYPFVKLSATEKPQINQKFNPTGLFCFLKFTIMLKKY